MMDPFLVSMYRLMKPSCWAAMSSGINIVTFLFTTFFFEYPNNCSAAVLNRRILPLLLMITTAYNNNEREGVLMESLREQECECVYRYIYHLVQYSSVS